MPEEDVKYAPREEILTFEEIERFARVAVSLGVTKIRVTGGEPLVRKDLPVLIAKLCAIPGVRDVALTTNGVLLARHAQALYDAGLRRLNVHLDTLDRERFLKITRRDDLGKVLEGIETAQRVGFGPIKINAVAVKNLVEPDIVPLARYGREHGIEIRFIEFMPLDSQGLWARENVLSADEIIETLSREISPLVEIPDRDPRAPATEYRYADGLGKRRLHRFRDQAVLPQLQSRPAHQRRQAALLPVRHRRDRRPGAAAQWRAGCRNRRDHSRNGAQEVAGARDQ
jgi:cyclic pyranopterin phosphate synthase